jgi:hypothetical protein
LLPSCYSAPPPPEGAFSSFTASTKS